MKNGLELVREVRDFKGTPAQPLSRQELAEKFLLSRLETEPNLARLDVSGGG